MSEKYVLFPLEDNQMYEGYKELVARNHFFMNFNSIPNDLNEKTTLSVFCLMKITERNKNEIYDNIEMAEARQFLGFQMGIDVLQLEFFSKILSGISQNQYESYNNLFENLKISKILNQGTSFFENLINFIISKSLLSCFLISNIPFFEGINHFTWNFQKQAWFAYKLLKDLPDFQETDLECKINEYYALLLEDKLIQRESDDDLNYLEYLLLGTKMIHLKEKSQRKMTNPKPWLGFVCNYDQKFSNIPTNSRSHSYSGYTDEGLIFDGDF